MYGSSVGRHLWEDTDERMCDVRPTKVQGPPDEVLQRSMRPGPWVSRGPAVGAQTETAAEKEDG